MLVECESRRRVLGRRIQYDTEGELRVPGRRYGNPLRAEQGSGIKTEDQTEGKNTGKAEQYKNKRRNMDTNPREGDAHRKDNRT